MFGDFNMDTKKNDHKRKNYETLLPVYTFKILNVERTKIKSSSESCRDHLITRNAVEVKQQKVFETQLLQKCL